MSYLLRVIVYNEKRTGAFRIPQKMCYIPCTTPVRDARMPYGMAPWTLKNIILYCKYIVNETNDAFLLQR